MGTRLIAATKPDSHFTAIWIRHIFMNIMHFVLVFHVQKTVFEMNNYILPLPPLPHIPRGVTTCQLSNAALTIFTPISHCSGHPSRNPPTVLSLWIKRLSSRALTLEPVDKDIRTSKCQSWQQWSVSTCQVGKQGEVSTMCKNKV